MKGIGTYALLGELAGTLVLSVPQQLNDAALIGGKTDDLTSDVPDELSAAGRLALGTADLVLGGVEGSGFLLSVVSRPGSNDPFAAMFQSQSFVIRVRRFNSASRLRSGVQVGDLKFCRVHPMSRFSSANSKSNSRPSSFQLLIHRPVLLLCIIIAVAYCAC